tara:strand:- start:13853 stop:14299 length:447 start_codon:yes stop_codon:yes gene_type:complete
LDRGCGFAAELAVAESFAVALGLALAAPSGRWTAIVVLGFPAGRGLRADSAGESSSSLPTNSWLNGALEGVLLGCDCAAAPGRGTGVLLASFMVRVCACVRVALRATAGDGATFCRRWQGCVSPRLHEPLAPVSIRAAKPIQPGISSL